MYYETESWDASMIDKTDLDVIGITDGCDVLVTTLRDAQAHASPQAMQIFKEDTRDWELYLVSKRDDDGNWAKVKRSRKEVL